jgi:predicted MPP superfamily phosphohydrolase
MRISELAAVLLIVVSIGFVYGLEIAFLAAYIRQRLTNYTIAPLYRSWYFKIVHILAIIGVICFIDGFFVEPKWIQVTHFEIESAKVKNHDKSGLRVVQFSDTHCETRPRNEKKLVEIVNSLKPDVIVFTGDSLNTPKALPLFKDTLKQMQASLGKFAVRGNFDSYFWTGLDLFSGTGFKELADETVTVEKEGDAFCITGFNVPCPENFQKVLQEVPAEKYSVLLYHYSDLAESLEGLNVDLYLSGHTHGGQVRLPFYGAPVTLSHFGKKYEAGMYTIGNMKLYVNRGIGLENAPAPKVRFLCRPEITVFDIKPKEQKK